MVYLRTKVIQLCKTKKLYLKIKTNGNDIKSNPGRISLLIVWYLKSKANWRTEKQI